jgi:hypothetical protein
VRIQESIAPVVLALLLLACAAGESNGPASTASSAASSGVSTSSASSGAGGAGGEGIGGEASSSSSSASSASTSATTTTTGQGGAGQGGAGQGGAGVGGAGQGGSGGAAAEPTFAVLRVGDGAAALTNAATAAFVEKRTLDGSLFASGANPLALPTAAQGAMAPLTFSGTASSEGGLSLSADGEYLVLAGYGAVPGTATVASTSAASVPRVVARIDGALAIDTTTQLNAAFDGNNVRGATSADGAGFWVSGNGSGGTGGVHWVPFGTTSGTQILTAPNSVRQVHVFAGQLYGSSGSGAFVNVFAIGVGLPTGAGAAATSLPGLPVQGESPYSFALLDRDPNVSGVDTLYIADDDALGSGGGVQKWTLVGGTWALAATFQQGLTGGTRGLAAVVTGGGVVILATTTETSQNHVVRLDDDGVSPPTATIVATAPANSVYRGVAIAP